MVVVLVVTSKNKTRGGVTERRSGARRYRVNQRPVLSQDEDNKASEKGERERWQTTLTNVAAATVRKRGGIKDKKTKETLRDEKRPVHPQRQEKESGAEIPIYVYAYTHIYIYTYRRIHVYTCMCLSAYCPTRASIPPGRKQENKKASLFVVSFVLLLLHGCSSPPTYLFTPVHAWHTKTVHLLIPRSCLFTDPFSPSFFSFCCPAVACSLAHAVRQQSDGGGEGRGDPTCSLATTPLF